MKRSISFLTVAYLLTLMAFIGYGYYLQEAAADDFIQASVEAPTVRISAKIPGRVDEIMVRKGDTVRQGDLVFTLDSPELVAKREQAMALITAKSALRERAQRGARDEELQMAKDNLVRAKADHELAQTALTRVQNLFNDGLVAEQKLDETKGMASAARFAWQAAEQRLQMAINGTEQELIDAAESDLRAAEGVLAEVDAALAETRIFAVKDGEVTDVLIHQGEISPAGFPVVTLLDMSDVYIRFHVTEDQLSRFPQGQRFTGFVPALDQQIDFEVSYVAVIGEYATWRASKPGEMDLRTFEVQARPLADGAQWRVGMSVVIENAQALQ